MYSLQLTAMLPKIDTILTGIQAIVTNPALSESIDHLNRITADLEVSSKNFLILWIRICLLF